MHHLQFLEHRAQQPHVAADLAEPAGLMQSSECLPWPTEQAEHLATSYQRLGQQSGVAQTACQLGRSFRHGQAVVQPVLV
jgi:hypothetical protein